MRTCTALSSAPLNWASSTAPKCGFAPCSEHDKWRYGDTIPITQNCCNRYAVPLSPFISLRCAVLLSPPTHNDKHITNSSLRKYDLGTDRNLCDRPGFGYCDFALSARSRRSTNHPPGSLLQKLLRGPVNARCARSVSHLGRVSGHSYLRRKHSRGGPRRNSHAWSTLKMLQVCSRCRRRATAPATSKTLPDSPT
jgi:hypothetical protein